MYATSVNTWVTKAERSTIKGTSVGSRNIANGSCDLNSSRGTGRRLLPLATVFITLAAPENIFSHKHSEKVKYYHKI
jgi:hypothetical protein